MVMNSRRYRVGQGPTREAPTPTGINVGLGSVAVVAATLVAAAIPVSGTGPRLGLPATALAGFSAATVDLRAAAAVTAIGYLLFDGFLVNEMGELSWRGAPDLRRLGLLAAAALVGLAVGAVHRWVVRIRRYASAEAWANSGPAGPTSTGVMDTSVIFDEGRWHGAGSGLRAGDRGAVRRVGAGGAGGGAAVSDDALFSAEEPASTDDALVSAEPASTDDALFSAEEPASTNDALASAEEPA